MPLSDTPVQDQVPEVIAPEVLPEGELGTVRLAAALISALLPGAGQWVLKRNPIAVLFHFAFAGLAFSCWYGRLPSTYAGFLAMLIAGWVIYSLSAWDALRCNSPVALAKSSIWLAVFLPIALLVSTAFTNAALKASGFRTYGIPSESMQHTLDIGDRLIVDTTYFKNNVVRAGDIIVFHKV